nr:MAG TPA: hypothetical protein [Caudoviricetes sp.]
MKYFLFLIGRVRYPDLQFYYRPFSSALSSDAEYRILPLCSHLIAPYQSVFLLLNLVSCLLQIYRPQKLSEITLRLQLQNHSPALLYQDYSSQLLISQEQPLSMIFYVFSILPTLYHLFCPVLGLRSGLIVLNSVD